MSFQCVRRGLLTGGMIAACVAVFCPSVEAQTGRVPWTSSRITGSPEPPLPYTVERILPEIQFTNPVDFALEPGTGHWFVLQLDGKLFAVDPKHAAQPLLVYDAHATVTEHRQSYGLEFHPNYIQNRQIFLSYVVPDNLPDGTHVSRFRVLPGDKPKIDPDSEELIITWYSGGHNGAAMKFGPDGMLYITAGDGTGPFPPDSANVGQDISDLRSTIMRIDVDHPDGDRPYSVPHDNPFLSLPDARPEVWSFGFRNPWKISFDQQTGELWCGDVGWELWELVFRVERGGNYGWSIKEGQQSVRSDITQGPGEIQPPIMGHLHTEARSVTGGYVYYGDALPQLSGNYIYGDYVTGKIWGLTNTGNQLKHVQELADTSLAIITFGLDADNELVIFDYAGGIYRLVPNSQPDTSATFPRLLSQTGIFEKLSPDLINAPGVYDYELITEMWLDGTESTHQVAIPGTASIEWKQNRENWIYPKDTVLVKTITLPSNKSSRTAGTRIETQVLHFDGLEWQMYSYVWNAAQTDAELAPASGKTIRLPSSNSDENGREWRIHSRAECATCHIPRAGNAIGFDFVNFDHTSQGGANQLDLLGQLGILDRPVPEKQQTPRMSAIDSNDDLQSRARSYLAINCAHCHRREGGGTSPIEFPFSHANEQTNAIAAPPTQGTFDIPAAQIIAPGDPHRSVLYYRLATVGRGHMPHLGARQTDEDTLEIIRDWILSLDARNPQLNITDVKELRKLVDNSAQGADVSVDVKSLIATTPQAFAVVEALQSMPDREQQAAVARVLVPHAATHIRGLFERFLPVSERVPTLGESVDPKTILSLTGNTSTGEQLFKTSVGVACRNCHKIGETGRAVGPDLTKIGAQRTSEELLESILEPSRKIDQKYALHTIETTAGRIHSGLMLRQDDSSVTLIDTAGQETKIQRNDIEEMVTQPRSMMPDLLVKDLTAQELADLLLYLKSLR